MKPGKTIKTLRLACGLKQSELSAAAGITQNNLSLIERDKIILTPYTANKLSKALDVPIPFIYALSIDNTDVSDLGLLKKPLSDFRQAVATFFAAYKHTMGHGRITKHNHG